MSLDRSTSFVKLGTCDDASRIRDQDADLITGFALHAPALLDYEFANVVARKAATGHAERAALSLEAYMLLGHRLHRPDVAGVVDLAQRYALSAYEATYLWLAGALKTPLATFDARLGKAAQRYLGSLGQGSGKT